MGETKKIIEFSSPIKLIEYVNSAKSAITLKSLKTGIEIDYTIRREIVDETGEQDILWIRSELGSSWQLMGRVDCEIFSAHRPESREAKAFGYFWNALRTGRLAAGIEVSKTTRT